MTEDRPTELSPLRPNAPGPAAETLRARDVTRIYDGRRVVDGASLDLPPGRIVALVGRSGSGKSTLLRLLAGLEPVDEGEVSQGTTRLSWPGHTVPPEKRRTGLIFQDFALFPHMTAVENVRFGLSRRSRAQGVAEARDWLARLGLAARADAYPHELSGGEQQRVAIARALAPDPTAILMDEPFSGLDPALRQGVGDAALDAIRETGKPALLVTHDAQSAMEAADWLAVMREGRIVQSGTPLDVYRSPLDADIAGALGPVMQISAADLPPALWPDPNLSGDRVVCVREEGVRIDATSSARGIVRRVALIGPVFRLTLELGPITLRALVPARDVPPRTGDEVGLAFDPLLTFSFPPGASHS